MSFKDKFLATRLAIENILFEKDISAKKKIDKKYYLYLFYIIIFYLSINLYYFYTDQQIIIQFIKSFDFSTMTIKEILFGGKILNIFDMPVYYLIFKFLSYFVSITPMVVFIVNSFLTILGIIGFFKLVATTKNESSAILATIVLLSTPFFIEISRSPQPDILVLVCVIWTYYYYLKMKFEEQYSSVPYYLFFYSVGLLSDKFFLIYTLPCFSFTTFLFSTIYSHYVLSIFVPSALIALIFYLRFLVIYIAKYSFTQISFNFLDFKALFSNLITYTGVINAIIIFPFFIWMIVAVYNIYVARKEILSWFFSTFIFCLLVPLNHQAIKFTIPALIIGFSVMVFPVIRRYLIYFMILFLLLSSTTSFSLKYPLWGYSVLSSYQSKTVKNILYALQSDERKPPFDTIVAVGITEKKISAKSFEIMKYKYSISNLRFKDLAEEFFPFSCYVITDRKTSSVNNFKELFWYKGVYLLKNPGCEGDRYQSEFKINSISLGEMEISDIKLVYDEAKKTTFADIGYFGYKGVDIYGLKLEIKNTFINPHSQYALSGFSSIKIINAIVNQYSVERFFERFKEKGVEVLLLKGVIGFKRVFPYSEVSFYFYPEIQDRYLKIHFVKVKIAFLEFGAYLSDFLSFKIPFDAFFIPIEFSKITIKNELIKIL